MEKDTVRLTKRHQPFSADLIEINSCKMKKESTELAQPPGMTAGEYTLFRSLSGNGSLLLDGKTFVLHAGDTVLLKTQQLKSCYTGTNWEFVQFRFLPFGEIPLFQEKEIYNIAPNHDEKLYLESMFYQKYSKYNYISATFCVLVHKLANTYRTNKKQYAQPDEKAIRFAVAYITEHLNESISIRELAEKLHLSERHFRQSFRKETGKSPKGYQQDARLSKCAYLLTTTTDSIQEISDDLGYYSPYQLSRDFKKKFGVSPSEYRHRTNGHSGDF